jgi:hypothetical protein
VETRRPWGYTVVKLFVEGGGKQNISLKSKCREGFNRFLSKAGLPGQMPRIIASGSREDAYSDFCTALDQQESAFLLIDSEGPVQEGDGAWRFLKKQDNWERPTAAKEEHCHLMVQCMETWLIADVEVLEDFFGKGFRANALPKRLPIEEISTQDVLDGLKQATQGSKKGKYDKKHAFDILAEIQPDRVTQKSARAKSFIDRLKIEMKSVRQCLK